jgi:hypothetical protein
MLKQLGFVILLSGSAFAEIYAPVVQLDEIRKIECKVPEGFGCGILVDLDLPDSGNMIASVVGGVVRQISVILDGTMYTVVYAPPLKRDDKFSRLRRYVCVPARPMATV